MDALKTTVYVARGSTKNLTFSLKA